MTVATSECHHAACITWGRPVPDYFEYMCPLNTRMAEGSLVERRVHLPRVDHASSTADNQQKFGSLWDRFSDGVETIFLYCLTNLLNTVQYCIYEKDEFSH